MTVTKNSGPRGSVLREAQRYIPQENISLLLNSSYFLIYLFLQLVIDYLSILQIQHRQLHDRYINNH